MELFEPTVTGRRPFDAAPLVARFAPVFWEPVAGTGERVVALVALEPHEATRLAVSSGTYVVLSPDRLRAMFGRVRGQSSEAILRTAAAHMTERQAAGLPLTDLQAPFHGLVVGPIQIARGNAIEQLLDGAVRSVSAFGSADEMVQSNDEEDAPRHTIRTATFLARLRASVGAVVGPEGTSRFDKRLQSSAGPEVTVDYAFGQLMVQVTSLPLTPKQAVNTNREAQSKLLELLLVRKAMDSNPVQPALLVNEDARQVAIEQGLEELERAEQRLEQLAKTFETKLIRAPNVDAAARRLVELA